MMAHYKDPSPPKKQQGILSKLKASCQKGLETQTKIDYAVTHVPVKSDAESNNFQRTQSDWSRTSSQSGWNGLEPRREQPVEMRKRKIN